MKYETLTTQELAKKARLYDNVQNEGGEGYNPYRAEIERREHEAAAARPKTKQDEIDALHHKIEVECGSVARECHGNEEIDAKRDGYFTEIERIKKEIDAEEAEAFAAEWTIETTVARRQGWNDFVNSLKDSSGKVPGPKMREVYARQHNQGWTLDALKKAVALHSL